MAKKTEEPKIVPGTDEHIYYLMNKNIIERQHIRDMTEDPLVFKDQTDNRAVAKETDIFTKLYQIDVRPYLFKKNKFDYLPWAVALKLLMENYPNASWKNILQTREIKTDGGLVKMTVPYFYDPVVGGLAVETEVSIGNLVKRETLPVIDYRNKIVKDPDWMAINTAQKRCLVKNISLFGLGLKVYEGIHNCSEDYNEPENKNSSNEEPPADPKEKEDAIIKEAEGAFGGKEITSHSRVSELLAKRFPKNAKNRITLLKSAIAKEDQYGASKITKIEDLNESQCKLVIKTLTT